jgi:hypothetical protein
MRVKNTTFKIKLNCGVREGDKKMIQVVTHTCNSSTQEAKAGGSKPAWAL